MINPQIAMIIQGQMALWRYGPPWATQPVFVCEVSIPQRDSDGYRKKQIPSCNCFRETFLHPALNLTWRLLTLAFPTERYTQKHMTSVQELDDTMPPDLHPSCELQGMRTLRSS